MDIRCCVFILIILMKDFINGANEKCINYAQNINDHHPITNYHSPKPSGKWVSSRCEVVPDAKFIFRRFTILSSSWESYIYHYSDSWCTRPKFIVKIKGSYGMLTSTATPNSKASFAASFKFESISVRSHNSKELQDIIDTIVSRCPQALSILSQIQKEDKIYLDDYINKDIQLELAVLLKKRCRYFFGLHNLSYQKIRITGDKTKTMKFTEYVLQSYDILYFGDIPPIHAKAHSYDNTKFQYGLSRLDRPNCSICAIAQNQSDVNKAVILPVPTNRNDMSGEWVSQMCEAGDDTSYLTRYYRISGNNTAGSISVYENTFGDPNCQEKQAEIRMNGKYTYTKPDPLKDILEIKIKFSSAYMTLYDEAYLQVVQGSYKCGDSEKWRKAIEQDVTGTNGCADIGLVLSETNIAVIRAYKNDKNRVLYIDRRKSSDKGGTYFTNNLVSCNTITNKIDNIKPPITRSPPRTKVIITVQPNTRQSVVDSGRGAASTVRGHILTSFISVIFQHVVFSFFFNLR